MPFLNVSDPSSENNVTNVEVHPDISAHKVSISGVTTIKKRIHVGGTSQGCLPVESFNSFISAIEEPRKMAYKATLERIYRQYMIDEVVHIPPKVEAIAAGLHMSVSTFNSLFRHHFGCNFYTCYMQKKMEYACQLLKLGYRAKHISVEIGYSQPIKFNKAFQKYLGITPKQYQRHYLSIIE